MNIPRNIKLNELKNNRKRSHFLIKILSSFLCILLFLLSTNLDSAAENTSYNEDPSKKIYMNSNLVQNYIDVNDPKLGSQFFFFLFRMKYVKRWNLFKNSRYENLEEHSFEVAIIAHALATIKNQYFNGNVNTERVVLLALFHDSIETLTDDIPTPVKYHSQEMKEAYGKIDTDASNEFLNLLPDKIKPFYSPLLQHFDNDQELWVIVKSADRISALIKCLEEKLSGNNNFLKVEKLIIKSIKAIHLKEVDFFVKEFMIPFGIDLKEYEKAA